MFCTYQHERFRHIHRIGMQIVNHNSCHNRSYRPLNRIVCQLMRHDIYCTRNMPHANAFPCKIDPIKRTEQTTIILFFIIIFLQAKFRFIPWSRFQWFYCIPHRCLQKHFHSIWCSMDDRHGAHTVGQLDFRRIASNRSDPSANPWTWLWCIHRWKLTGKTKIIIISVIGCLKLLFFTLIKVIVNVSPVNTLTDEIGRKRIKLCAKKRKSITTFMYQ